MQHPKLHVMKMTHQIKGLHTIIRDKNTSRADFIFYSDRLMRFTDYLQRMLITYLDCLLRRVLGSCHLGNRQLLHPLARNTKE